MSMMMMMRRRRMRKKKKKSTNCSNLNNVTNAVSTKCRYPNSSATSTQNFKYNYAVCCKTKKQIKETTTSNTNKTRKEKSYSLLLTVTSCAYSQAPPEQALSCRPWRLGIV